MRSFNQTEPMRHPDIVNTDRLGETEFRSSFMPSEAASAVSEFGQDDPPRARSTASLWERIRRWLSVRRARNLRP